MEMPLISIGQESFQFSPSSNPVVFGFWFETTTSGVYLSKANFIKLFPSLKTVG